MITGAVEIEGPALGVTGGTGTVTAVTGSSPIASSGGTTPAISFPTWPANSAGALVNDGAGVLTWDPTDTGGPFVKRQAATPGVQEVGNFNISGTGIVGTQIGINTDLIGFPDSRLVIKTTGDAQGSATIRLLRPDGQDGFTAFEDGSIECAVDSPSDGITLSVGAASGFALTIASDSTTQPAINVQSTAATFFQVSTVPGASVVTVNGGLNGSNIVSIVAGAADVGLPGIAIDMNLGTNCDGIDANGSGTGNGASLIANGSGAGVIGTSSSGIGGSFQSTSGPGLVAGSTSGPSASFQTGNVAGSNTNPTVIILGNTGQTAMLTQWYGDDGTTPVANVSPAGNVDGQSFSVNGAAGQSTSFVIGLTTYTFTNGILTGVAP